MHYVMWTSQNMNSQWYVPHLATLISIMMNNGSSTRSFMASIVPLIIGTILLKAKFSKWSSILHYMTHASFMVYSRNYTLTPTWISSHHNVSLAFMLIIPSSTCQIHFRRNFSKIFSRIKLRLTSWATLTTSWEQLSTGLITRTEKYQFTYINHNSNN